MQACRKKLEREQWPSPEIVTFHLALSFLVKQDAKLVLSFSLLNASLPPVCPILEAHKWNNLVLSVMAPQTASAVCPCNLIVLETCHLKGTLIPETQGFKV